MELCEIQLLTTAGRGKSPLIKGKIKNQQMLGTVIGKETLELLLEHRFHPVQHSAFTKYRLTKYRLPGCTQGEDPLTRICFLQEDDARALGQVHGMTCVRLLLELQWEKLTWRHWHPRGPCSCLHWFWRWPLWQQWGCQYWPAGRGKEQELVRRASPEWGWAALAGIAQNRGNRDSPRWLCLAKEVFKAGLVWFARVSHFHLHRGKLLLFSFLQEHPGPV